MKILAVTLAVALAGCATGYRISTVSELDQIPDDCRNKDMLIKYLENQTHIPKPLTESQKEYDAKTRALHNKIWHLRYVCRSA